MSARDAQRRGAARGPGAVRNARIGMGCVTTIALTLLLADLAGATRSPRSVVGAGATSASGVGMRLAGTVGQTAVGQGAGSAKVLAHGFWGARGAHVVSADPPLGGGAVPGRIDFGVAMPNPTRGPIAFALALPRAARVELTVLDVQGRIMAERASSTLPAGYHRLILEPGQGAPATAGIYFARLVVNGRDAGTRRFVRLE